MRLDRFLSLTTNLSRSDAKKVIKEKQIKLMRDQQTYILSSPSFDVNETLDQIYYGDTLIEYQSDIYIMLNKPKGYITATYDQRLTVMDLIDVINKDKLFPVGRLDMDTVGLLLITSDGNIAHKLLSPKKHVNKKYYVVYSGIHDDIAEAMVKGIYIKVDGRDYLTMPAFYEPIDCQSGYLTIKEGKFHQVKKMFLNIGLEVTYLKRVSFGSLTLDEKLNEGSWRYLTADEIATMKK